MYGRTEEFKGMKGYIVKYFAFCYNNAYQIHKEAKYSASYWLQELSLETFKGTQDKDEQDRLIYRKDIHGNDVIKNPKERQENLFTDLEYNKLYWQEYNTNSDKEGVKVKEIASRAKTATRETQRIEILEVI